MPKILITGAGSFIGTNFIRISKNKDISEISLKEVSPEHINFDRFDVVLHLAAIVHQSKRGNGNEYFKVNRDLCLNVAQYAKRAGVRQFIFLSTIKVFGQFHAGSDPWNEESECNPEDAYGKSKYEAEIGLQKLNDHDFIVSIIRTPIVYGAGVRANMLRIIRLVEILPILPFSSVNNNRHYTYIENLVGFIDRIIEVRTSGIFIVMDDTPLTTTSLVTYVSHYMHRKIVMFKFPAPVVKLGIAIIPTIFDRLYGSFYLDNKKTKKILNYNPPFTTEEGLTKMISSYLDSRKKSKASL
jgi:UDP-glucose 4-epimerase